ncbi:MAG: M56 family metallopeptidase [Tepidisphaeraceae bacterium]
MLNIFWALVGHSIWQAAVIVGVSWFARHDREARTRCAISRASVLLFIVAQLTTAGVLIYLEHKPAVASSTTDFVSGPIQRNPEVAKLIQGRLTTDSPILRLDDPGVRDPVRRLANLLRRHDLLIASLWSVALGYLVLRTMWGLRWVRRVTSDAEPIESTLADHFRALGLRLGLLKRAAFVACDTIAVPATTGWWHPKVLLPPYMVESVPRETLDVMVLHELAHIRWHDYPMRLLLLALTPIYAINPFFWAMRRQVTIDSEMRCDQAATAAAGVDALTYADAIVAVAESKEAALALGLGDGPLVQRIRQLKRDRARLNQPASIALVLIASCLAVASLGYVGSAVGQRIDTNRALDWVEERSVGVAMLEASGLHHANPDALNAMESALAARRDGARADDPRIVGFIDVMSLGASGDELALLIADNIRSDESDFETSIPGWRWGTARERRLLLNDLLAALNQEHGVTPRANRIARACITFAAIDQCTYGGAFATTVTRNAKVMQSLNLTAGQTERIWTAIEVMNDRRAQFEKLLPPGATTRLSTLQQSAAVAACRWSPVDQVRLVQRVGNDCSELLGAILATDGQDESTASRGPYRAAIRLIRERPN